MYSPVFLYDAEGNFIGLAIMGKQLHPHVWGADEHEAFNQRINELNEAELIKQYWPSGDDPDVIALLDDPNFMPIKTEDDDINERIIEGRIRYREALEVVAKRRAGMI